MKRKTLWGLCCATAILLAIIGYSPLVIPPGQYKPMVLGMPYTLWTGILVTLLLVLVTFLGTLVHPGQED